MLREPFFIALFVSVAAIGTLHHLGLAFFLYWRYWWFDVVTHFLGGLVVGFAILWFLHHFFPDFSPTSVFLITFGFVILVGIGWEVFEYAIGVFVDEPMFPDSIHDLFADSAGGLSALALYVKRLKRTH